MAALLWPDADACGRDIGFAEFSLRRDYAEGTDTREAWARETGCRQTASDCELPNETSLKFHLRCGFSEANRIVCFVKDI